MTAPSKTLIEVEIDGLVQKLNKLSKSGQHRRWIAYGLKFVAGGAGLVIALDVFATANKWLGAAILAAVFIDAVFANYERLIGEIRASHAAKLKRAQITAEHNVALVPIINRMRAAKPDSSEYVAASEEKDNLEISTHKALLLAVTEIEQALATLDLNALKSLSLEAERAATGKT